MDQVGEDDDRGRNVVHIHEIQKIKSTFQVSGETVDFHHDSKSYFVGLYVLHHCKFVSFNSNFEVLLCGTALQEQVDDRDVNLDSGFDHLLEVLQSLHFSSSSAQSFDQSGIGNEICFKAFLNLFKQIDGSFNVLSICINVQSAVVGDNHSWKMHLILDVLEELQCFVKLFAVDEAFDDCGENDGVLVEVMIFEGTVNVHYQVHSVVFSATLKH